MGNENLFNKTTEQVSSYRHLEKMSTEEMVKSINTEDATVAGAVRKELASVIALIDALTEKLSKGGRLFYVGAGTSGRLGILDASEWAPTFGVPETLVNGLIAGGAAALRVGIEDAEDSYETGWHDLQRYNVSDRDFVIGIAASGTTPYVAGALKQCRDHHISTGCIVCNPGSPVALYADYPIEVIVGPEFVTGSTRMKSGTAQKMVLNMISTSVMIKLGRVHDNRMVHMKINNEKLIERGTKMFMEKAGISNYEEAKSLLLKYGSVHIALNNMKT
ncbi:N-acetylmuramic acid 6-phosphate etherase [Parafilimonas sp.]|uniref:N-acetylmuramic acid 6-phosphate etherase n=1 Tax=Parafilimonas sp. TaxID=1969739 RepID=UPI0039E24DBE